MEGADVFWQISKAQHQPCSSLSETTLDRFLDQLKDFREVEAPVQALRYTHAGRGYVNVQNSNLEDELELPKTSFC